MPTLNIVKSEKKVSKKKWLILPLLILMILINLPHALATDLSEGTYIVDYEMLQAENDSVSIANDYFEKPAILTIDEKGKYLQFTMNHAQWIEFIKSGSEDSFTDVQVISEDLESDERVVAFKVDGDITAPLLLQMHVVIEDMEPVYDHKYSVRLGLDLETLKETDAPAVVLEDSKTNEKTGDASIKAEKSTSNQVIIYVLIAIIATIGIIFIRKFSKSRKTKK